MSDCESCESYVSAIVRLRAGMVSLSCENVRVARARKCESCERAGAVGVCEGVKVVKVRGLQKRLEL